MSRTLLGSFYVHFELFKGGFCEVHCDGFQLCDVSTMLTRVLKKQINEQFIADQNTEWALALCFLNIDRP